jgi:DNA-binding CsgD family transcriptional regulator
VSRPSQSCRFAGIGDILRAALPALDTLPSPQADAIRVLLGLTEPRPLDRLTIGAACLSLLAAAADRRPLVVVVDDAHWLDPASQDALAFVARRLGSDPIAMLLAARDDEAPRFAGPGIDELPLAGLAHEDARALLAGHTASERVADELIERTAGNPLALLTLPAALSAAQLRGDEPLERPLRVGTVVERGFSRRVMLLGEQARLALVVVAGDDSRDGTVIAAALAKLDLSDQVLEQAEDAGLLCRQGTHLDFVHPLIASAVYHGAAPSERRAVHAALAGAFTDRDPERHAWHLATAAVGEDARAASALQATAERSRSRGAHSAAGAAFERAARLTAPGPLRVERISAAADSARLTGRPGHAAALVDESLTGPLDPAAQSSLLAVRGRISLDAGDPATAHQSLVQAAELIVHIDPAAAGNLLADAMVAATQLGTSAVAATAERLRALGPRNDAFSDFFIAQALAVAASAAGDPDADRLLAHAVALLDQGAVPLTSALELFWAGRATFMLGHNTRAAGFARRALDAARRDGALGLVPQALRLLGHADHDRGHWRAAYAAAGEAVLLAEELGQRATMCASLGTLAEIDAAAGNEASCGEHVAAAVKLEHETGLHYSGARARLALGRLALGLGRLQEAADQFEQLWQRLQLDGNREINITPAWDLVETYTRLRRTEDARRLLSQAEREIPHPPAPERARVWRCHALLTDDFRPCFERALAEHDDPEFSDAFPLERARTQLCFGERLRRAGERRQARMLLQTALTTFDQLGAVAWSARAASELGASGAHRRVNEPHEHLTPRETQIALAVAEGHSNKEIAAALFLTPKTVECHLTRIYRKTGVRSRTELVRRFTSAHTDRE